MAGKSDDVRAAIELGRECIAAVDGAGPRLTGRLRAGWRDGVLAAVRLLSGEAPGSSVIAKRGAREATKGERDASTTTVGLVSVLRQTMNESGVPATVLRAWGSGMPVRADNNKSVSAFVTKIVARAASNPEELAALGLETSDVQNLAASAGMIGTADTEQGQKQRTAKAATAAENAAIATIYRGVAHAASRGILEFSPNALRGSDRPASAAQVATFQALYDRATPPTSRAKKLPKPKKT